MRGIIAIFAAFLASAVADAAYSSGKVRSFEVAEPLLLGPRAPANARPTTQPLITEVEPSADFMPDKLELRPEPSVTDVSGVELADLRNDVYTLAYRNDRGLGIGLASTGGVALTGGYATEGGMQINLYLIRAFPEMTTGAAEVLGIEAEQLPEESVGLTIGWKF